MIKSIFNQNALKYWGIALFVAVWWIIKNLFFHDSYYLPGPIITFARVFTLFSSGEIFTDILSTLKQFFIGFTIAAVTGIPIGLILGFSSKGYATFEIIIDFFRSIPVTALFPLFILFFGISSITITAMISTACFFVILLNSAYGVLYVNKTYLKVIKILKANRYQTFKEVIIYEALPFIFVGIRIAVSFGLIVVIVSEMFIGSRYGLGSRVYKAHETYLITDVYALTIIIGLLGYFMNKILITIEKKVIHWKGSSSEN